MPTIVTPGRYQHYKGKPYAVLFTAAHSETGELLVIYRAEYGDRNIWARPLSMFMEKVDVGGTTVPRFAYLDDGADPINID